MKEITLILFCTVWSGCEVFGGMGAINIASYECGERWPCTDRDEYTAVYQQGEGSYRQYGFTITIRFENRWPVPVFIERCNFYGVILVSGPGDSVYNPNWACTGQPGQSILPGAVLIATLVLKGPNIWQYGQPLGVMEGDFQLIYDINRCPDEVGCGLEEKYRVSNIFKVRVEK